jgi:Domain of Unknown Function (DUF930)
MAALAETAFPFRLADALSWRNWDMRWAVGASLGLHVAFALALLLQSAAHLTALRPQHEIAVRVLTREQFEAATRPHAAQETPKPATPAAPPPNRQAEKEPPPVSPPPEAEPGAEGEPMIRATQLFSAGALSDPLARQVKATLPFLAAPDRIMQLCNIEAIEQIRRWRAEFQPDYLVADAMSDATLRQQTLDARGGAIRARRHWYHVKYRCEVTPNAAHVVSFAFLVGKEIPRAQWKRHYLTLDGAGAE